jgi:hypothetical protein
LKQNRHRERKDQVDLGGGLFEENRHPEKRRNAVVHEKYVVQNGGFSISPFCCRERVKLGSLTPEFEPARDLEVLTVGIFNDIC